MNRNILFVLLASVTGVLAGTGCAHVDVADHMLKRPAYRAEGIPRIKIDEPASMMVLKYLRAQDAPKMDVIRATNQIWNRAAGGDEHVAGLPARVIIEARSDGPRGNNAIVSNELGFLLTGGVIFLFGVPTGWDTQMVTLRVQIGKNDYVATGKGKCYAGLYYPGDPGPCAFSKALTEAIKGVMNEYLAVNGGGTLLPVSDTLSGTQNGGAGSGNSTGVVGTVSGEAAQ